jgi:hypothetical protein
VFQQIIKTITTKNLSESLLHHTQRLILCSTTTFSTGVSAESKMDFTTKQSYNRNRGIITTD